MAQNEETLLYHNHSFGLNFIDLDSFTVHPHQSARPGSYADMDPNKAVWFDNRNGQFEIWGYDLGSDRKYGTVDDGGEFQVTDWHSGYYMSFGPKVSGNIVVWPDKSHGDTDGDSMDNTLGYYHDLSTGTDTLFTHIESNMVAVDTDGRYVAWQNRTDNGTQVWYLDTRSSSPPVLVAEKQFHHYRMIVTDGRIAWIDWDLPARIMVHDISTGVSSVIYEMSADGGFGYPVSIHGDGSRLLWMLEDESVWLGDLDHGISTRIDPEAGFGHTLYSGDHHPMIGGNRISWSARLEMGSYDFKDIFMIDLSKGAILPGDEYAVYATSSSIDIMDRKNGEWTSFSCSSSPIGRISVRENGIAWIDGSTMKFHSASMFGKSSGFAHVTISDGSWIKHSEEMIIIDNPGGSVSYYDPLDMKMVTESNKGDVICVDHGYALLHDGSTIRMLVPETDSWTTKALNSVDEILSSSDGAIIRSGSVTFVLDPSLSVIHTELVTGQIDIRNGFASVITSNSVHLYDLIDDSKTSRTGLSDTDGCKMSISSGIFMIYGSNWGYMYDRSGGKWNLFPSSGTIKVAKAHERLALVSYESETRAFDMDGGRTWKTTSAVASWSSMYRNHISLETTGGEVYTFTSFRGVWRHEDSSGTTYRSGQVTSYLIRDTDNRVQAFDPVTDDWDTIGYGDSVTGGYFDTISGDELVVYDPLSMEGLSVCPGSEEYARSDQVVIGMDSGKAYAWSSGMTEALSISIDTDALLQAAGGFGYAVERDPGYLDGDSVLFIAGSEDWEVHDSGHLIASSGFAILIDGSKLTVFRGPSDPWEVVDERVENKLFNLVAEDLGTGSDILLSWDPVTGYNSSTLDIYYSTRDFSLMEDASLAANVDNSTVSYTVSDLDENVRYYFVIVPAHEEYTDQYLRTSWAIPTINNGLSPSRVINEGLFDLGTGDSLILRWRTIGGGGTGHRVYWDDEPFENMEDAEFNAPAGSGNSFVIEGLTAYKRYWAAAESIYMGYEFRGRTPLMTAIPTDRARAEWTYIGYFDGDNNLHDCALDDLNEMDSVGSTDDLNMIVLLDLDGFGDSRLMRIEKDPSGYSGEFDTGLPIHESIDDGGFVIDPETGEVNMGSPDTLWSLITWTMLNYPANHYMLDLWDHGSGWYGVAWDDTNDHDHLTVPEIGEVLRNVKDNNFGRRIDLLSFSSCLNAMAEVVYEVSDGAEVMVASEDLMPGDGHDYKALMELVADQPALDAGEIGSFMVRNYRETYEDHYDGESSITLSAVDTAKVRRSLDRLDALFGLILDDFETHESDLRESRNTAQKVSYNRSGPSSSNVDLIDFLERFSLLTDDMLISEISNSIVSELAGSVIDESHGGMPTTWPGSNLNGLMFHLPQCSYSHDPYYGNLSICSGNWSEFIRTYYTGTYTGSYTFSIGNPSDVHQWVDLLFDGDSIWSGYIEPNGNHQFEDRFWVPSGFTHIFTALAHYTITVLVSESFFLKKETNLQAGLMLKEFGWVDINITSAVSYPLHSELYVDGYLFDEMVIQPSGYGFQGLYLQEGSHTMGAWVYDSRWVLHETTFDVARGETSEVEMEVGDQTHGWAYLMVYDYDSACQAGISINGKPLMDIILSPGWNNIGWVYLPEGENRIDVIAKEGYLGSGTIITSITGGVDDQEIIVDFYIPHAYIWLYVANNEEEGLHFDLLLDGELYDSGYVEGNTIWTYGYMDTIAGTHTITVKWNGGSRSETVALGKFQELEVELEMGEFTWERICLHFLSKDRNFQYLTLFIDDYFEYETTLFYADYNQYYWTWLPSGIHTVTMEVWDGSISDFRYIERTLVVKEGDTEDKWFYLEPGEGKIEIPYIPPSMTRADDDPLSVHIDGLEEGEVIGGEFTISGTAFASESNISAVYMRFDKDEWRELDGKDSWTFSFNTLALDDGYHTVAVMVADDEGRTSVDTGYFRVSNGRDGLDPVVHINSHSNNQSVQTDVIISGTASAGVANGTISSVEYRIDGGSWMKADGTGRWQFEPFTDPTVSGSYLVEVRSGDGQTFSTVVSIRLRVDEINNPEHEINVTSPEMNENVTGNLVVTGDVDMKGDDGELKVQLSMDGGKWFDITSGVVWEYTFPSGSLSSGKHRLDARATLDGISSPVDSVTFLYDPLTGSETSMMDIISPSDSSAVFGTVEIVGMATNVATSAHLEARIDDGNWIDLGSLGDHASNGSSSSGDVEWSFSWNTTFRQWDEVIDTGLPGVRGGFHTISVKLTGEGQYSSPAMVSVNITSEEYLIDGITSPLETKDLPRIISMDPEEGSSDVYANQDIELFFNTRMVPLDDVFVLRGPDGASLGLSLEWGELNMSVRVIPSLDMDPGLHELIMKGGMRSLSGIPVTGNMSFSFSVSGGIAPGTFSISSVYPEGEETDIPLDVVIEITFTHSLDPATISGSISLKDDDGQEVSFDHELSDDGKVLELKTRDLEYDTNYTVSISDSLASTGGLGLSRTYSWTFRTEKDDGNGGDADDRDSSSKTGILACGAILLLLVIILAVVVVIRRKNGESGVSESTEE